MNGTLVGIIAILTWATTGLCWAYAGDVPPFEIGAFVFFTGWLMMTVWQLWNKEDIVSYWKQPLAHYIFWLLGPGLYTALFYVAFTIAPVFEVNTLNYMWPILLMVFASITHEEPLTPVKICGMLAGFAGTVLIIYPEGQGDIFSEIKWGHVFALLAAFIWAIYSAMAKKRDYPIGFFGPAFFVFGVICLGIHLGFEKTVIPEGIEWVAPVFLGLFRISYALWDYGMKKGDVQLLASLCYFLPLMSTFLLVISGNGPDRPLIALGAALVVAGCIIVNSAKIIKLARS